MKNNPEFNQKSELLKALAHPIRLCIAKGLIEKESNVTSIQECLGLPQSTISQHLFNLKNISRNLNPNMIAKNNSDLSYSAIYYNFKIIIANYNN